MKRKHILLTTVLLIALLALAASSLVFAGCDWLNPAGGAAGTVDLYAINDFHGEWDKMSTIAGYLVDQKNYYNALLLNSGDMFQGSMQSNSNYGTLLSECMDLMGFDSFTLGNHEFDWGLDKLRALSENSQVPFLGANIYNWDRVTGWGSFADDIAQEYVIKELDNGLKVGIIGIIGKNQITSTSSQFMQTIGFKDPKDIVPGLSDKLRNDLGCDVVVISAHVSAAELLDDYRWDVTDYADAVFCAHSHAVEQYKVNGVPLIQGGAYGSYVSHVRLQVDRNGNVSCKTYENIEYSNSWADNSNDVDDQVASKINNSNQNIKDEADKVLAELTGTYLNSSTQVPCLVANAIADYAVSQGYDIELVMVNNARNSLEKGPVTYSQLYEAIPFDNLVYVAKVLGSDILHEASYGTNSIWRVKGTAIQSNKYYTIAVIDYLLFHQNTNREYNYFPSAFESGFEPEVLTKEGVDAYNYRLITRDFLLNKGAINAWNYVLHTSSEPDRMDKDKLGETLPSLALNLKLRLDSAIAVV